MLAPSPAVDAGLHHRVAAADAEGLAGDEARSV